MPPLLLPQLVPVIRRQAIFAPRATVGLYSSARRRGYAIDSRQSGFQGNRLVGPNQDAPPGVNEETGGMDETIGEEGPDMSNSNFVNEVSFWWSYILAGMVGQ